MGQGSGYAVLPRGDIAGQVVQGILVDGDGSAVHHGGGVHLIVEVGAGGGAGVAGDADNIALRDILADADLDNYLL